MINSVCSLTPKEAISKEIYRSDEMIPEGALAGKYEGGRNCSTGIYFLLTSDTFSAFHQVHQDEGWHFYQGSPILLHTISPEGQYSITTIGNDILNGEVPQYYVKGGTWFGATVKNENDFSLVGCTVSPGFDFRDFVLADRRELLKTFPAHQKIIGELTRL